VGSHVSQGTQTTKRWSLFAEPLNARNARKERDEHRQRIEAVSNGYREGPDPRRGCRDLLTEAPRGFEKCANRLNISRLPTLWA
jgi:hypothetical protein